MAAQRAATAKAAEEAKALGLTAPAAGVSAAPAAAAAAAAPAQAGARPARGAAAQAPAAATAPPAAAEAPKPLPDRDTALTDFAARIQAGALDGGDKFHRAVQKEIYPLLAAGIFSGKDLEYIAKQFAKHSEPAQPRVA